MCLLCKNYFLICCVFRSTLVACSVCSLMSFRSSAVLTTTPFWYGTSWTSQPTASQRDGLLRVPTRIFLDSRYLDTPGTVKPFYKNPAFCVYPCGADPPVWHSGFLTQVSPSTVPFLGGTQGWLVDRCIRHGKEPISSRSSLSSLCPSPTQTPQPPPLCQFWQTLSLCPLPAQ